MRPLGISEPILQTVPLFSYKYIIINQSPVNCICHYSHHSVVARHSSILSIYHNNMIVGLEYKTVLKQTDNLINGINFTQTTVRSIWTKTQRNVERRFYEAKDTTHRQILKPTVWDDYQNVSTCTTLWSINSVKNIDFISEYTQNLSLVRLLFV